MSLLIFIVSAAGLLFCLIRLAGESPGAALTAGGSPPSEWTSYFQRGRYLADLRTTVNLVKYLFEPDIVLTGRTNILHG